MYAHLFQIHKPRLQRLNSLQNELIPAFQELVAFVFTFDLVKRKNEFDPLVVEIAEYMGQSFAKKVDQMHK